MSAASLIFDVAEKGADLFLTAVGLIGVGWSFLRWVNRPRFICGVPPLPEEWERLELSQADIGTPSIARAFRHRSAYFAERLRDRDASELSKKERERLASARSCRSVTVDEDGRVDLPVVLENRGARSAPGLTASIVLLPSVKRGVRLVNAATESLDLHVYASDLARLEPEARSRAASPRIVDTYSHFLRYVTLGDGVWLAGDLSAHTYEMVCLTVWIEPCCDWFHVVYTVNSADGFVRASTFIQACRVEHVTSHGRNAEAGSVRKMDRESVAGSEASSPTAHSREASPHDPLA